MIRMSRQDELLLAMKNYADAKEKKGVKSEWFLHQVSRKKGGNWQLEFRFEKVSKTSKKGL